jgi:hypothetical protein
MYPNGLKYPTGFYILKVPPLSTSAKVRTKLLTYGLLKTLQIPVYPKANYSGTNEMATSVNLLANGIQKEIFPEASLMFFYFLV